MPVLHATTPSVISSCFGGRGSFELYGQRTGARHGMLNLG